MIKYCDREHHFSIAEKLQIGTLKYYQNHTNVKIADPKEGLTGTYEFFNPNDEIEVSRKDTEFLSAGAIKGTGIKVCPGGRLETQAQQQVPNLYIFCGTDERTGNKKTAKSLGYKSWYEIVDIDGFMQAAAVSMGCKIRFTNALVWQCELRPIHRKVEYHDEKTLKLDKGNSNKLLDSVFSKSSVSALDEDIDFRLNNEYRLLWLYRDKTTGLAHDVNEEPILIDFTPEMKSFCR